jgi:hypothetical protein
MGLVFSSPNGLPGLTAASLLKNEQFSTNLFFLANQSKNPIIFPIFFKLPVDKF